MVRQKIIITNIDIKNIENSDLSVKTQKDKAIFDNRRNNIYAEFKISDTIDIEGYPYDNAFCLYQIGIAELTSNSIPVYLNVMLDTNGRVFIDKNSRFPQRWTIYRS